MMMDSGIIQLEISLEILRVKFNFKFIVITSAFLYNMASKAGLCFR